MRQKRAKTYKRVMALYTQAFNFRQPFQILGTFLSSPYALLRATKRKSSCVRVCWSKLIFSVSDDIIQCTNTQSDLWKQLAACVQAEIKPSKCDSPSLSCVACSASPVCLFPTYPIAPRSLHLYLDPSRFAVFSLCLAFCFFFLMYRL